MTSQAATQIVQTVGRNIALARTEAKLSQREVGVEMGMDARGISRWENGHVLPSPTKLAALSTLFSRDIAWFYTEHDVEPAEPAAA